jgi:hypothetical protein
LDWSIWTVLVRGILCGIKPIRFLESSFGSGARRECNTQRVGFFSEIELPVDAYREPEPRRVKWRGDSDDTVGALVPAGPFQVHNDQVAIVVTGFFAYPAGFTFSLVTISRLNPPPAPLSFHHPSMAGQQRTPKGELRFGIEFSDGSKLFQQHRVVPGTESSLRSLRSRGGGGGGRKWNHEFWCEPLPPAGSMTFVFEWGDYAIPETSIDVDGTAVVDAANRAISLWPEDADLPEDPDRSPRQASRQYTSGEFRKREP